MRKVPPGHMKDQKLVMVIEGNTSDASSKTDSLSFGWGGGFLTQSHESRLNAVGSMMDQQTKSQSSSSVQTTMTTASLVLPNETGNEGKRFFMFRAQLTFGLSTKGVVNVPALFRHWIQTNCCHCPNSPNYVKSYLDGGSLLGCNYSYSVMLSHRSVLKPFMFLLPRLKIKSEFQSDIGRPKKTRDPSGKST